LRIEKNFKVLIKQIEKLQVQLEKEIEQRTIKQDIFGTLMNKTSV
jgi:hypothetical protein